MLEVVSFNSGLPGTSSQGARTPVIVIQSIGTTDVFLCSIYTIKNGKFDSTKLQSHCKQRAADFTSLNCKCKTLGKK